MFYQALQYIKFLLKSTNQHGVHSPFVYDLITKCFYDKAEYSAYNSIKNYRARLKRVKTKIEITDLGSGSKRANSNYREVSTIAKVSGTTLKRSKLLYRISNYFKSATILELGTSLGFGTQALSLGNPDAKIITIEGCPNISKYTKTNFRLEHLDNISVITGRFKEVIPTLELTHFDLVFFDGHHDKQATIDYFNRLLPKSHNDTCFIFDDIYWSKDMTEAWEYIKQHPSVTVSIDTFYWGFVFFRKEQRKEHFRIRV